MKITAVALLLLLGLAFVVNAVPADINTEGLIVLLTFVACFAAHLRLASHTATMEHSEQPQQQEEQPHESEEAGIGRWYYLVHGCALSIAASSFACRPCAICCAGAVATADLDGLILFDFAEPSLSDILLHVWLR
jgi:hypothetical protein